jgi:hypothetical protein
MRNDESWVSQITLNPTYLRNWYLLAPSTNCWVRNDDPLPPPPNKAQFGGGETMMDEATLGLDKRTK